MSTRARRAAGGSGERDGGRLRVRVPQITPQPLSQLVGAAATIVLNHTAAAAGPLASINHVLPATASGWRLFREDRCYCPLNSEAAD